jgi:hypothetical protein
LEAQGYSVFRLSVAETDMKYLERQTREQHNTHISSSQLRESMHWELISICSPLGSVKLNIVCWSRRAYPCEMPLAPYDTILQVVECWVGTPSHLCRVLPIITFIPIGREASFRTTSTRLLAAALSMYVKAWRLT